MTSMKDNADDTLDELDNLLRRLRDNDFPSRIEAIAAAEAGKENAQVENKPLTRALIQNELARIYSLGDDSEKGLENALESEKVIRELGSKRELTSVVNCLGVISDNLGHYENSLRYYLEAYELSVELDFPTGIGHTASNVGLLLHYFGDHDGAISYYQKSLEGWKNADNQIGKANVLVNLSLEYEFLGDFESAEKNLLEAFELSEKNADLRSVASILRNMALLEIRKGNLTDAEDKLMQSLTITLDQEEVVRSAHIYHALSELEEKRGHFEASLDFLDKAEAIYEDKGIDRGVILVRVQRSQSDSSDYDTKKKVLIDCLEKAVTLGLLPEQIKVHKALRELEGDQGNWERAYNHLLEEVSLTEKTSEEKGKLRAKSLSILLKVDEANRKAEIEHIRQVELKAALDESERQKKMAEEENRQKTEFFNIAAHDLRNMTGGILSLAEVIRAEFEEHNHSLSEPVETLESAASELYFAFEKMLDTNLIESGKIVFQPELMSPGIVIKELFLAWRDQARKKNQQIILAVENSQEVELDRIRFVQIITNVVSNAIKYSGWGADIRISSSVEAEHYYCINIADRGPGLSSEQLEEVNAPFKRFGAVPTGGESSHGLGLYIVKQLVALHHAVQSVHPRPGGGTVFCLKFPLKNSAN